MIAQKGNMMRCIITLTEADDNSIDDAPMFWDDERFLAELGFGDTSYREQEEDITLTNVMQQLGNVIFIYLFPSSTHFLVRIHSKSNFK